MKHVRKGSVRKALFLVSIGAVVLILGAGFALSPDSDLFFKINRGIDTFGKVYKEVTINYVDEVDPEKFMGAGIQGMLGTLDPYTVYIDREEGDEVDLLTTGKYGGIGVTIGNREGAVVIISVMDGYSAQRQGILPGDVVVEIDGVPTANKSLDDVRALTRGEPGTQVKVTVKREGEPKPLVFTLVREQIQVKNVTYTDYVSPGIGYVRLERFSRGAGEEVRQAIGDLQAKGVLRGLVLDLRGNPGGLLDAAVDVVSRFVPRGSLIVSTRGRRSEADKRYLSTEEPVLPSTPLVILADHNSASASEIVAGAIQDLDRGLIVGTRTFGKGLVQTILPLNDGAQLKITTARYYTPSGRCIQAIQYNHSDKSGVFVAVPDSERAEFKTADGRPVFEHGGITPDSTVINEDPGPMVRELYRTSMFFAFANTYVGEHKGQAITGANDQILADFRKYLSDRKFDFQEDGEKRIAEFRKAAEDSHYGKEVLHDLDLLSSALGKERQTGFDRYRDHITHALNVELMARINGEHGRIAATLQDDQELAAAIGLLNNTGAYARKIGK